MRLINQLVVTFTMLFVMSMVLSARNATESELLKFVEQGIPDAQLIRAIGSVEKVVIDLSLEHQEYLKSKGVSDAVLKALVQRQLATGGSVKRIAVLESEPVGSAPAVQTVQSSQGSECPERLGLYYHSGNNWIPVDSHRPTPKVANGAFKSALTSGLTGTSAKWEFSGSESPLKIADSNVEFCVRGMVNSQDSIALVTLKSNNGKREVEYSHQSLLRGSSGRKSDVLIPVSTQKTSDGAILVKVSNLEVGAYAFDTNGLMPDRDFNIVQNAVASRE